MSAQYAIPARCLSCEGVIGVIREQVARDGDWLDVLERACPGCSAAVESLVEIGEGDAALAVARADLPAAMVVVPDNWPGEPKAQ